MKHLTICSYCELGLLQFHYWSQYLLLGYIAYNFGCQSWKPLIHTLYEQRTDFHPIRSELIGFEYNPIQFTARLPSYFHTTNLSFRTQESDGFKQSALSMCPSISTEKANSHCYYLHTVEQHNKKVTFFFFLLLIFVWHLTEFDWTTLIGWK